MFMAAWACADISVNYDEAATYVADATRAMRNWRHKCACSGERRVGIYGVGGTLNARAEASK